MHELTSEELRSTLQGTVSLVSCLSFEDRSLSVAKALPPGSLRRWLCILNEDIETDISEMRNKAEAIAAEAGVSIQFLSASKRNPLLLADALIGLAANPMLGEQEKWIGDITTMTHEMLLMLVAAADEIVQPWRDLLLIYNLAGTYSGDDTPEEKWVSRGIHEVRSVVGYPGAWSPGEPTKMIALPGFDPERMRRMVEEIEPDQLVVGIACPIGERHVWSAEKNRRIAEQLLQTRKGATFDYPALDPLGAIDAVIDVLRDTTSNVLLAPLNSKITTAALGVLARLRPEWQICYAPAFIYNLKYATPSDCFLTCSLDKIRAHVSSRIGAG
ncbi:hypothetical protein [Sphingomonas sp. YL-JM2C]